MQIHFEFRYPEKFLSKIGFFSYITTDISLRKYPMGKKAGKFENAFFRITFRILGFISFWIFMIVNWFCRKIFGIDWLEENS